MQVKSKIFKSSLQSWDTMAEEAGEFATSIGRERLISLSHSADTGQGVIIVWYWE
jgi:hypothetical protein